MTAGKWNTEYTIQINPGTGEWSFSEARTWNDLDDIRMWKTALETMAQEGWEYRVVKRRTSEWEPV